jgi:hypothetical protein
LGKMTIWVNRASAQEFFRPGANNFAREAPFVGGLAKRSPANGTDKRGSGTASRRSHGSRRRAKSAAWACSSAGRRERPWERPSRRAFGAPQGEAAGSCKQIRSKRFQIEIVSIFSGRLWQERLEC